MSDNQYFNDNILEQKQFIYNSQNDAKKQSNLVTSNSEKIEDDTLYINMI